MQRDERNQPSQASAYRKPQSPAVTHSDLILFLILIVSIISLALRLSED